MSRPFEVRLPLEEAYNRRVSFAVQLLDAVTLSRVSQGVKVVGDGLNGKPIVNAGGIFVWLEEDLAPLKKVTIDPKTLPYEKVELDRSQLQLPPNPKPLTTVELPPRIDYPFTPGITGMRGTLIEERVPPPQRPVPVGDAEVHLRWLGDFGMWFDAPTRSHTSPTSGDFISIIRLAPNAPTEPGKDTITVNLRVRRNGNERSSTNFTLPLGRITDPSTLDPLTFAWDELQP